MKYDVFYHHTSNYSDYNYVGIEIQPPMDADEEKALLDRLNGRLNARNTPKSLQGVAPLYCNGHTKEGAHFLGMPSGSKRFEDLKSAKGVASYIGRLLRQDEHEVTVAHRSEWDGELMGSHNAPPAEQQVVPEPEVAPGVVPAPQPEV